MLVTGKHLLFLSGPSGIWKYYSVQIRYEVMKLYVFRMSFSFDLACSSLTFLFAFTFLKLLKSFDNLCIDCAAFLTSCCVVSRKVY